MGFYYFSPVSFILAFIVSLVLTAAIVAGWSLMKLPKIFLFLLVPAAITAPFAEELWIAYNFGHLCGKDAGLSIYKTVETDGFYDETGSAGFFSVGGSGFRYVEQKDLIYNTIQRIEKADDVSRARALAWLSGKNRGKGQLTDAAADYRISDKEKIVVSQNGSDAWRVTLIDKPSARYQYTRDLAGGVPVAHKVFRQESKVTDVKTGEVLGRHVGYGRGPYEFFIHVTSEGMGCDEPGGWPHFKHSPLVYQQTLRPIQ